MNTTTAEALAVVREALEPRTGETLYADHPKVRGLAALAFIEQEVDRRSGLDVSQEVVDQLKARAEKAEAERDELLEQARGDYRVINGMKIAAAEYERRVAELEAALRELLAQGIDDVDPRLGYVYIQADRKALESARALLGGGGR